MIALRTLYPEHQEIWKEYRPLGYWKDLDNQRAFFDALAIKLNIHKPEDWYRVTRKTVIQEGGYFVPQYYGSVTKGNFYSLTTLILLALQSVYPDIQWLPYKRFTFGHTMVNHGSKSQATLYSVLKSMFADTTIILNYKIPKEGLKRYEFDVSIFSSFG